MKKKKKNRKQLKNNDCQKKKKKNFFFFFFGIFGSKNPFEASNTKMDIIIVITIK
jgi:hypothetical protein